MDDPIETAEMLDAMKEANSLPEFECFDVGIVRSVGLYLKADILAAADNVFLTIGQPE